MRSYTGFRPKVTKSYVRATHERDVAVRSFQRGDRVKIVGGDMGHVDGVNIRKKILIVRLDSGREIEVSPIGVEKIT